MYSILQIQSALFVDFIDYKEVQFHFHDRTWQPGLNKPKLY